MQSRTLIGKRAAADRRAAPQGPARARANPGGRGRGIRRGDEHGHRHRVRPHVHRPGTAAIGAGSGQLSARERELVTLVAQGRTNAQIAVELHISVPHDQLAPGPDRDKTGCRRRSTADGQVADDE